MNDLKAGALIVTAAALIVASIVGGITYYNVQWMVNRCEITFTPSRTEKCLGPVAR